MASRWNRKHSPLWRPPNKSQCAVLIGRLKSQLRRSNLSFEGKKNHCRAGTTPYRPPIDRIDRYLLLRRRRELTNVARISAPRDSGCKAYQVSRSLNPKNAALLRRETCQGFVHTPSHLQCGIVPRAGTRILIFEFITIIGIVASRLASKNGWNLNVWSATLTGTETVLL